MKAIGEVIESLTTGGQIHTTGNLPAPLAGPTSGSRSPQKLSSTTGAPLTAQQLQSAIGKLLSETGSAAITPTRDQPWQGTALNRLANICERRGMPLTCIAASRLLMRELLRPAPEDQLATRVMAFMAHYYDPKMGESIRSVVLLDWCRMLGSFPMWSVESAMDQWLSKEQRKPTPKTILELIPYAVRSPSIRSAAA